MMKLNKRALCAFHFLCAIAGGFLASSSQAQGLPASIFTEALTNGESTEPLPDDKNFGPLIKALKNNTGNTGPIVVKAMRIMKFEQQSNCGRIVFMIMQPASKTGWNDLGGQLNICEDGGPPLRMCKSHPGALYPFNTKCPDGTQSTDTAEVELAIKKALSTGGLSYEQVRAKVFKNTPPQDPKSKEGASK